MADGMGGTHWHRPVARALTRVEMIDPKEVMRRYSVEELCATADDCFRVVGDPTPLMSKPFAFLHETPQMLENLGLLLAARPTESVAPGGELTLGIDVHLPGPGRFELVFNLVAEGVSWFENLGSDPIRLRVHARDTGPGR